MKKTPLEIFTSPSKVKTAAVLSLPHFQLLHWLDFTLLGHKYTHNVDKQQKCYQFY